MQCPSATTEAVPWSSLVVELATLMIYHLRRSLGLLPEDWRRKRCSIVREMSRTHLPSLGGSCQPLGGIWPSGRSARHELDRTLRPTLAALLSSFGGPMDNEIRSASPFYSGAKKGHNVVSGRIKKTLGDGSSSGLHHASMRSCA